MPIDDKSDPDHKKRAVVPGGTTTTSSSPTPYPGTHRPPSITVTLTPPGPPSSFTHKKPVRQEAAKAIVPPIDPPTDPPIGPARRKTSPPSPKSKLAAALRRQVSPAAKDYKDPWRIVCRVKPEQGLYRGDLIGWFESHAPSDPDAAPPYWACEFPRPISKETRNSIMERHLGQRTGHLWFVDPEQQLVEVYVMSGEVYVKKVNARGAKLLRLPPFETVELDFEEVWNPAGKKRRAPTKSKAL